MERPDYRIIARAASGGQQDYARLDEHLQQSFSHQSLGRLLGAGSDEHTHARRDVPVFEHRRCGRKILIHAGPARADECMIDPRACDLAQIDRVLHSAGQGDLRLQTAYIDLELGIVKRVGVRSFTRESAARADRLCGRG